MSFIYLFIFTVDRSISWSVDWSVGRLVRTRDFISPRLPPSLSLNVLFCDFTVWNPFFFFSCTSQWHQVTTRGSSGPTASVSTWVKIKDFLATDLWTCGVLQIKPTISMVFIDITGSGFCLLTCDVSNREHHIRVNVLSLIYNHSTIQVKPTRISSNSQWIVPMAVVDRSERKTKNVHVTIPATVHWPIRQEGAGDVLDPGPESSLTGGENGASLSLQWFTRSVRKCRLTLVYYRIKEKVHFTNEGG